MNELIVSNQDTKLPTMKLARVFNNIEKAYGKKLKKYSISFNEGEMFFKLNFGEGETIMVKIWVNQDLTKYNNPYSLVLFKSNIYSNKYLMTDWSNYERFSENFFKNKIDYIYSEKVELDIKMNGYVLKTIDKNIIYYTKQLANMKIKNLNDEFYFQQLSEVIVFNNIFQKYLRFKKQQLTKSEIKKEQVS